MKKALLSLMLVCFAFFGVARAEVVEIGSGTTGNSYLPTYSFYNYSLTQQIYPACEIGTAGTINSIAFHNVATSEKTRTLDVYFVLTDKSTFSGTQDWITVTADDLVYSGSVTFPASDWVTLTLTSPFALDGTNNLAVIVDDNTGSYVSGLSCAVFDAPSAAIRVYSDGTNYNPFAPTSYTGAVLSVKNCIQLDITPDPSVTLCCPPDAITVPTEGITAHEAVVNWEGGAAPYTVEYKKTTDTEWTVGATGVTGLTTTLTGLTQNTAYQARVQSGCGSAWVTSTNFTTLVSVVAPTELTCTGTTTNSTTLSWTENGTATSWVVAYKAAGEENFTEVTVNENPYTITGLTHSTAYAAKVCAVGNGENSSWSNTISFATECEPVTTLPWNENFDAYTTGISTSTSAPTGYPNVTFPTCWQFLNLSESSTTYPIAFISSSSSYVVSGNCLFFKSSSETPIYAILPEFSENIADLYLTFTYRNEGVSAYNGTLYVGYMTDPTDATTFTSVYTCAQTTTLTEVNLQLAEAPVNSYIAFKYEGGSSNNYYLSIDNVIVNYPPACAKPNDLAASDEYAHGATLTWISNASAWQIQLDEEEPMDVRENPFTLTDLDPETDYSVKVRAVCGDDVYSEWTAPISFTTTIACPAPTALTVALTSGNGSVATLSWTENGTATDWEVEYGEDATFVEFRVVNVENTPSVTLEDLTPETKYFARVKTNCQEDGYSLYSNVATFTPTDALSITVNNGTDTNGQVPVFGYWADDYSKSQFIIPAADLADMTNSLITKMTFYSSNASVSWGVAQFEVYVAEVENTTFESAALVDWTSMTKVRNAGSLSITNNMMEIELTSPYQYMGGNLMVGILETTSGTYSSCNWYGVNQETNTAIGGYETSKGLGFIQFLPKTTFNYEAMPNCFATNLTIEPAAESAALAWTSENENFDIWYREISEGMVYDFEDGMGDWTTIDADGDGFNWENHINSGSGNHETHSGDGCMTSASYYKDNENSANSHPLTPDNYLVSPLIELGGSITFWACAQDADWPSEHFGLAVSTTGNTDANDFTTIQEWTMTAKSGSKGGSGMASRSGNRTSGTYYEYTVDLSAYSGQGYVAIRHFNCTDWFYLNVDDISIVEPDQQNPWIEATSTTNSYTITGLTPQTQYEVQVRANCGDGEYSEWLYDTFTTLPLCEAPTITGVEAGTDYITLSWESEAEAFDIALDGETIEEAYEGYTYTFENLDPGTTYQVKVRTNCGEDGTSEWVGGNVTTKCLAFALPYEYNFDDVLTSDTPEYNCWSVGSTMSTQPALYYRDQENGDIMFTFVAYQNTVNGIQYLITPEFETTSNPILVEFEYEAEFDNGSYGYDNEAFQVGYSEDGDSFEWFDEVEVTSVAEWETFSEEVPAGTKYVAILYTSPGALYLNIDNFSFTEAAAAGQTTELSAGWNWFSTYIEAGNDPIGMLSMVERSLGENGIVIKDGDITTEYDEEWGWFGDLDEIGMVNEHMYMIRTSAACTVELEGEFANPADHAITIVPGWNWIGYPCSEAVNIEDALAGFEAVNGDIMKCGDIATEYDEEWGWFGDIETMVPGQGYMLYSASSETRTLVYQTGSKASRSTSSFKLKRNAILKSFQNQPVKINTIDDINIRVK